MPEWIPVEQALPEPMREVMVCTKPGNGFVARRSIVTGKWISIPGHWNLEVIAWQPLPAPYQPKKVKP